MPGQSLAALLGPLGEEPISLRNEQHVPPGFWIAHCGGDL